MNTRDESHKRYCIDTDQLPALFPTHRHARDFWELLGRCVATFSFLEEMLKKAIFVIEGAHRYGSDAEAGAAYDEWVKSSKKLLSTQLSDLAERYEKSIRNNPDWDIDRIGDLVRHIKEAAQLRNVLCHGSWRPPDDSGASLPFFVSNRGQLFETPVNLCFLIHLQRHTAELACHVIDSVQLMGYQFPGSNGPGKKVWD